MKPSCLKKWFVVMKGNGKFSPRISIREMTPYWPYQGLCDFDTFEQAKEVLLARKLSEEKRAEENREQIVFELK